MSNKRRTEIRIEVMATTLLGKNLKTLRRLTHMNQEKLANAVGVTRTRIASYETQNIEPKLALLAKFASFFDISIDTLLAVDITSENYESLKKSNQSVKKQGITRPLQTIMLPKHTSINLVESYINRYRQIEKAFEGVLALHALQDRNNNVDLTTKQLVFIIRQLLNQNALLINELERKYSTNKLNK